MAIPGKAKTPSSVAILSLTRKGTEKKKKKGKKIKLLIPNSLFGLLEPEVGVLQ